MKTNLGTVKICRFEDRLPLASTCPQELVNSLGSPEMELVKDPERGPLCNVTSFMLVM